MNEHEVSFDEWSNSQSRNMAINFVYEFTAKMKELSRTANNN